jgi:hypothetical protein
MNRDAGFQVHSEARGPHWVAWITHQGETSPYRSVLLVGPSKEEAEERARKWGEAEAQIVNSSPSS